MVILNMRVGSYAAWSVREENFPREGGVEEKLRFLLRYAVLAPSAHNTQPWMFRVEGNHVTLFPDFSRALGVSDPTRRELYLSLGCALANLLVAAEHFGFQVAVEEFPGGEVHAVARLSLVSGGTETQGNSVLFAAVAKRRTNRGKYENRAVPVDALQRLRGQASDPAVRLDLVPEKATIAALAGLTAKATLATLGRADFRSELSQWVRSNYTKRGDGMPGFSVGVPNLPSLLAPLMVRLPPMVKAEAKKARDLIMGSPLVAVISTRNDDSAHWVKAGALFERLCLATTAAGLCSAPYAGAFEAGSLHEDVERLLGIQGFRSQSLLRIGYGPEDSHPTPRRDLADVLRGSG